MCASGNLLRRAGNGSKSEPVARLGDISAVYDRLRWVTVSSTVGSVPVRRVVLVPGSVSLLGWALAACGSSGPTSASGSPRGLRGHQPAPLGRLDRVVSREEVGLNTISAYAQPLDHHGEVLNHRLWS